MEKKVTFSHLVADFSLLKERKSCQVTDKDPAQKSTGMDLSTKKKDFDAFKVKLTCHFITRLQPKQKKNNLSFAMNECPRF